ncbi:MAG: ATPase, T2SS/T4P/T4SS family [Eubacteriales bacterium]|nr:ATPase, T2SS/T4P/T4SS family [Eubacteriales bacterium]
MDNISKITALFPLELQAVFMSFDSITLSKITEIRLRKEKPIIIYLLNKPFFINCRLKLSEHFTDDCICIDDENFDYILDMVCNNSYHTKINTMIKGYVTVSDGIRIGIASTAVVKDGEIKSVKDITSLNIRVAREINDCALPVLNMLYEVRTPSIIVAGPPGSGKTTFLRDISKKLSSGFAKKYRKTVIIDEREEIAAGFNVGINTDIIKGFSKSDAVETAVRTLSPDIIICDEIGNDRELDSIKFGFSSGVSFIVTVHAKDRNDLLRRTIIKNMIDLNEFEYIILLKNYTNDFEIYDISEVGLEICRKCYDNTVFFPNGNDGRQL